VRWLLASYVAFLLPFGLIHLPEGWLDIRYAYLPATCFCGLLAYGLRVLWLKSGRLRQVLLSLLVIAAVAADVTLVRRLEQKYDEFGKSEESRAQLMELQGKLTAPQPQPQPQPQ
jgi:hypothetical protein